MQKIGTIEGLNNKINTKITHISSAISVIRAHALLPNAFIVTSDFDALYDEYRISTINVLAVYYSDPSKTNDITLNETFRKVVGSQSFISKFDALISRYMLLLQSVPIGAPPPQRGRNDEMARAIKHLTDAQQVEINIQHEADNFRNCSCGASMRVVPELSELHCEDCGITKNIVGMVFRDDQFYPQEGQKTKHGEYEPVRHLKAWLDRILGREKKEFAEEHLKALDARRIRDGCDKSDLNCELMRKYISEESLASYYNDNTTLLIKILSEGRVKPPELDHNDCKRISALFLKIMDCYKELTASRHNRPYYPHFIYKIVESIFDGDADKLRLLDFIHLQSDETLKKNDKLYEKICERANDPDLKYRPTNRRRK